MYSSYDINWNLLIRWRLCTTSGLRRWIWRGGLVIRAWNGVEDFLSPCVRCWIFISALKTLTLRRFISVSCRWNNPKTVSGSAKSSGCSRRSRKPHCPSKWRLLSTLTPYVSSLYCTPSFPFLTQSPTLTLAQMQISSLHHKDHAFSYTPQVVALSVSKQLSVRRPYREASSRWYTQDCLIPAICTLAFWHWMPPALCEFTSLLSWR